MMWFWICLVVVSVVLVCVMCKANGSFAFAFAFLMFVYGSVFYLGTRDVMSSGLFVYGVIGWIVLYIMIFVYTVYCVVNKIKAKDRYKVWKFKRF